MEEFNTNEECIYSLIIEELDEQLSPEKKQLLEDWRTVDPANENTYQEFVRIQQNLSKLYDRHALTPEESWEALNNKLEQTEIVKPQSNNKSLIGWLSIAASLLLIFSIVSFFLNRSKYTVVSNEEMARVSHVFLPDGTHLSLNTGASVRYITKDFIKNRKLELLEGEVFITVKHDAQFPFVVELGELQARDIGTSFNIIKDPENIVLSVEEGEVALEHNAIKQSVLLTAGTTGRYSALTNELSTDKTLDRNYKAWKDKDFVFVESPLRDVVRELGSAYHTDISIRGIDLNNKKLTARLHYQTPDSALKVIAATLQCKLEKAEGNYILSDK